MQFVTDGPDIPNKLLQAHEEDRVIFFCGAGISYPAGLPGFQGLVDKIYQHIGTTRSPIQEDAYKRNQFDATLNLLEQDTTGGRSAVRNALNEILQPNLRLKGATDTHLALLQLARTRENALRLVTTNFDRIFERVAKNKRLSINVHVAPMLPIPKNSRWDGLVHLHGLLPEKGKEDESALQRLVLTSGDFGLAYLTERWAARFVSELFCNYVVCFVGYSINDPVLRYMMDALAADRMLGEKTPRAYAFGDCYSGEEDKKTIEWETKGVTPILYNVPEDMNDHSKLHKTLKAWAQIYQEGTLGREHIVTEYAGVHPSDSTQQDDFVGRMLWALSHDSGLPAKRFSEFDPVPSLDWLEFFAEDRYKHEDLSRFGVSPSNVVDDKLKFSLIDRPAPYQNAPRMKLFSNESTTSSRWDDVMSNLACWLIRHLNNPALIIWLTGQGGELYKHLAWLIENKLDYLDQLKLEGDTAKLEDIRNNAPDAIPCDFMKKLWRLLIGGRIASVGIYRDIFSWERRLKRHGLNTALRLELRNLLAPSIAINKPSSGLLNAYDDTAKDIRQLVDYELVLTGSDARHIFRDLNNDHWNKALPKLLDEFQLLLYDALDLFHVLGDADQYNDRSHWDMPSISKHWQNRGFNAWTVLIELLRDSWLKILEENHGRASEIAQKWFQLPYPTFKRLALFAASHDECIESNQWVNWLTTDDARWLWVGNTQREIMRLLVLQGKKLEQNNKSKLETAILKGPPQNDCEFEDWQSWADYSVWLRLSKLLEGGCELSNSAVQRYDELSVANPKWELATNESDEFSHWMSGTGDPDYNERLETNKAPHKRQELVKWLKEAPVERRPFYKDTWREICSTRFFHALLALCDLAKEKNWPVERWRDAFQAWSQEGLTFRSWRFAAPLVQTMPDEVFQEITPSIAWWLEAVSKPMDRHENILLELCARILKMPHNGNVEVDDPVSHAINHSIGHVTKALINLWFKREPNDNDNLPVDIEPFFSRLCDTKVIYFRHGRVLLASRLISLFRVDRLWTENNLLPLFDWNTDTAEAKAVWEGFLWSPRLYWPLLLAFKSQLLETVHYYSELGVHNKQFATFLTYAALSQVDGYTPKDFQNAFKALPQNALEEAARTLPQALNGASEQREEYWKNRIKPFMHDVWPKSKNCISTSIIKSFARMSIAAKNEFPAALAMVLPWLKPIEDTHYIIHLLSESKLPEHFPNETLKLLDAIIANKIWNPKELKQCLDEIGQTLPKLLEDNQYKRLGELIRQQNVL